ncbi:hypothetical protein HPB48_026436 [Haemaphysalis longicornis]|uniref:Uncharacterized protein n=1 Tax=Haemaphysalis longicornis TaxID=44386 RepID=A0A9J6HCB3_HAELO|nr:hypothetical protein HPB48_026436 [Haemaphysalis longicornis]
MINGAVDDDSRPSYLKLEDFVRGQHNLVAFLGGELLSVQRALAVLADASLQAALADRVGAGEQRDPPRKQPAQAADPHHGHRLTELGGAPVEADGDAAGKCRWPSGIAARSRHSWARSE